MNVHALIPAAGMGRRMGASINKQYLQLAGRPILAHTLALFAQHPRIASIVVVTPEAEIPYCRDEVIARYAIDKVKAVVPGGAERQDSVRLGLAALEAADDDDLVLIHDGVRPLFDTDVIAQLIEETLNSGACLVGVPAKDTIKEVSDGKVVGTPDRERLWLAQTPQAFRLGLIREAHQRALQEGFCATDDAMLVEWCGHPVAMVPGNYRNIKITTPEDLLVAEAWLTATEKEVS